MGLFLITRSENFRSWILYPSLPSKQRASTIQYVILYIADSCHCPRRLGSQRLLCERERKLNIFTICCINMNLIIKPDFTKPPSASCTTTLGLLLGWYYVVTGAGIRILISAYRCRDDIYYSKRSEACQTSSTLRLRPDAAERGPVSVFV